MRPTKAPMKAVTPGSVKVLMLVEAGIIGFLAYWILSEYIYNAYFRTYIDQILLGHVTTFTAALGLGIGLAGSAVAAASYRNLQRAKNRLETIVAPKIKGAVDKILSGLPALDEPLSMGPKRELSPPQTTVTLTTLAMTAIVPVPPQVDQKKSSS